MATPGIAGTLSRPRILCVCSSWPAGEAFGGQLRALQICRALKEMGEVTVTAVGAEGDDRRLAAETADEFAVVAGANPVATGGQNPVRKIRRLLDTRFLDLHGVQLAEADRGRLLAEFKKHDLVWMLNARTPNLLNLWSWPGSHLDLDDIPSTYLRRVESRDEAGKKPGLRQSLMKRRERLYPKRFTTVSVCSTSDREDLGGSKNIHVIPNGFQDTQENFIGDSPRGELRIGFIGLCTYEPNRDGVQWFLDNCWPKIRAEIPGIRFRIAGKGGELFAARGLPDVDVLGWVPDSAAEIATWSATVIPIRFGAGTRVKLAEAFSRKCPVISTSTGAFGYEVTDGRELLIADDSDSFANKCASLVRDRNRASQISQQAYETYRERWTWDAIAPRIWATAEDCLTRSKV